MEIIMNDWNPGQYLKFKNERTQPAIDLLSRIKIKDPEKIIDLGCGPGNSTQILHERWPDAHILGIDNSREMIKKAAEDFPDRKWAVADIAGFKSEILYDLVFSNATLQWIHNHEKVLPDLFALVEKNGALAVQVPANNESPLHKALIYVSDLEKWNGFTGGCGKLLNYQSADYYYNLLNPVASVLELWETVYYHEMNNHYGLIEWYKSTGMRPFLESIPGDEKKAEFENEVLEKCRDDYKIQKNGKILYPFKRIFFIAYK
jgi:trans-aconitate 2-methyltransferase